MKMLDPRKLTRFRHQPVRSFEVRYNCPHCGNCDGKLYANFKKGGWICFACGQAGSILNRDVLMVNESPAFFGEPLKTFQWNTHPDVFGSGSLYLKNHNIPVSVAMAWGVRSGKGDCEGRLVFPVYEYHRDTGLVKTFEVAHSTFADVLPKELQSGPRTPLIMTWNTDGKPIHPGQERSDWNPFQQRTLVLCEGAADAMRLAAAALTETKLRDFLSIGCLWGKHLSEETTFSLCDKFDNFYVCLDKEERLSRGGETVASMNIMEKLNAVAVGLVSRHGWEDRRTDNAKDPAELDTKGAVALLRLALKRTGG